MFVSEIATQKRISTRQRLVVSSLEFLFNYPFKVMSNDLATKVTAIIVEKLGIDEDDITNDASFTNDLGADSLDTVELIMEFEKEFDVTIPDEDAEKIATVGDAISYLTEQTA